MSMSRRRMGGRTSKRFNARAPHARPAGQQDGPRHEVPRDLFLRGREMEKVGDPVGALDVYARLMADPATYENMADVGAILYHVGDCSSRVGDRPSAWESYLAAARVFHEHCEGRDVGASLGKAGLLLVDFCPLTPIREAITHATLRAGLVDALDHAVEVFLGRDLPTMGTASVMHQKLAGLMVLAGGAGADVLLTYGAYALCHRVADPFSERPDVRSKVGVDGLKFVVAAFDALARLYEALGEQETPGRVNVPPTIAEVRQLTKLTTIAFAGDPQPLMSRWLGSYLRDRRGATWATDEALDKVRRAR